MLKLIMIFLILGAVPMVMGMPWAKAVRVRYTAAFAYGTGYFLELALFHVTAFLSAICYIPFHVIIIVYSVLLGVFCLAGIIRLRRMGSLNPWKKIRSWERLHWHEWILLAAFIAAVTIQIYHGFVSDLSYMAADDSYYTALASDVLSGDYIGMIDAYTGVATVLNMQRTIQTSLYFPAFLSAISGISVAAVEHTVQYIQLLILAYSIYTYLSEELFDKRDNRLAFLAFVSIFYIFGYHSLYSLTFRLLGPNYQGKAILAVSLTPLVLALLIHALKEPYRWQNGVLLLALSLSAVSLTLWGAGTMLVIVIIPVILSLLRKQRNWKHLLYIPWGIAAPIIFIAIHSIYTF